MIDREGDVSGPARLAVATLAVLLGTAAAADSAGYRVKAESLAPPDELSEPVRKELGKDALTVSDAGGEVVLTVWFRPVVPARATAEQVRNGLTYREIPDGTLVGAVKFPSSFTDFRKQEIAAGVYTLRFAVQPETGDHMGTAPYTEFLLLSPAAKDASPDPLEPKALYQLSAGTTGGDHPGVMLLFPHDGKKEGPEVTDKGDGVRVLAVRRAVEADGMKTSLGFALTVAGHSKAR
jgi:hypothetical protein